MEIGAGNKVRMLPIHTLVTQLNNLSPNLCLILPALHHLTGGDYTSKVGTKKSALKANPETHLLNFGFGKSREL